MKKQNFILICTIAAAMLLLAGCIFSGTFTISKSFSFKIADDIVSKPLDLTTESDWKEHQEEIDQIDGIGFDVWITNTSLVEGKFNIWIDRPTLPTYNKITEVEKNATLILDGFIMTGTKDIHLTYGNSFKYLRNLDSLKTIIRTGQFDLYLAHSESPNEIRVDSGQVVITFTAH
ncbi:MAG: hypothetical protein P1R58_13750 [bacterium]|nr:hypothetical protein [bacterium]